MDFGKYQFCIILLFFFIFKDGEQDGIVGSMDVFVQGLLEGIELDGDILVFMEIDEFFFLDFKGKFKIIFVMVVRIK